MLGGLGSLFYVGLLLINAMAILNEERFLARIGWTSQAAQTSQQSSFHQPYDPYSAVGGIPQQDVGVKTKLVNLIGAVRTLMRVPLIFINVGVIIYELLLGGR
ncbi:Yos1-like protein [Phellopilus nigrolimitatus]|nr:Yos1-like protein [Phellopilus nigrolimitatus]